MKFNRTIFLQLALCFSITILLDHCSVDLTKHEGESTGVIDADDPNIQYVGRFDFSNPKKVIFDWAGVSIRARFEGTSCSLRLADHGNEYAVIVDDRAPRLLIPDSAQALCTAVSGLPDSVPHTIIIQKRTEPLVGRGELMGFVLDKGRTLLPPDKLTERRIEFIGNSITSGYGVEGESPDCHFSPQTENACMSYAAITARSLNAEYSLISYSGRGVVRNYGDSNRVSLNPMPALYDRTCYCDSGLKWNFSRWVPQVVIINLGTNDFSTQPFPDSVVFQSAYTRLIERVRSLYPGVTMFCISGPMTGEPCTGYIKKVVEEQKKMMKRYQDVFFIEINRSIMTDADWGCDRHPNIQGMAKMAEIIIPTVRLRMNW
jgi:Carbohydrate esterase 2 N-terminal/GDSL-like Lipase/Acylhydrolase family